MLDFAYTPRPFLNMTRLQSPLLGIAVLLGIHHSSAQSPYKSTEEFAKYAMKLRETALSQIEPRVSMPTTARTGGGAYGWKNDIVTTVFWVGENSSANNPVHNRSSSWDLNWASTFGGFDNPDPSARVADLRSGEFRPRAFVPRANPFYIALPYNDVTRGSTKPEAPRVIPWFRTAFVKQGQSVCRDRWIAVRNRRNGRIAYGQWSDCGPFSTDHYQYVFGNEKPKPNLNRGAGLDISPAMRDYLGLAAGVDVTDWRFVEVREVPEGPWRRYGENNQFVQQRRRSNQVVVSADSTKTKKTSAPEPNVVTRITR